jgi:transposase
MPLSMVDWLPDDHLAWFVIDAVTELDLGEFYGSLREDGRGGAAYDPATLVGVLLYAYCVGERSSRRIERRLIDDVAFRVIAANQFPDHATIARFRRRHAEAIANLFTQVLGLCVSEGLVASEIVSIDGTKMWADVGRHGNRSHRELVEEIMAEAERVDSEEDERFGERRGDELPERLAPGSDRRARLREALRQMEADGPADYEAIMAERERKEAELGHKIAGRKPSPTSKKGRSRMINVTDPDARTMWTRTGYLQGYNAQAAVSDDQVIVAAEVSKSRNDTQNFIPVAKATEENLVAAGAKPPKAILADTGYWSTKNLDYETDAELLIPPMPSTNSAVKADDPSIARRGEVFQRVEDGEITVAQAAEEIGASPNWTYVQLRNWRNKGGDPALYRQQTLARLATDEGRALFARRKVTVEPIFGNIKANLGYRRFSVRGINAVSSEWRLICMAHNLLKVQNKRLAAS